MIFEKRSGLTGKYNKMELPVTVAEVLEWQISLKPKLIQDQFPQLSADQREFLLTGSTPEEWDAAFGEQV
jgi:hypothetical protein